MALQLNTIYKTVNCNYWRVNKFLHDDVNDTATIELCLYKDEAAANAGLAANLLDRKIITLSGIKEDYADLRDSIKHTLYAVITASKLDENGNETNPFANAEEL